MGMKERLKQAEPLFGAWHVGDEIGGGSYGRVYRLERQDAFGTIYISALKAVEILSDPSENTLDKINREYMSEVRSMDQLRGAANIAYLEDHDLLEIHENGRLIGYDLLIRMEYLTSLTVLMRDQDEKLQSSAEWKKLGMDVCRGLMCCEAIQFMHRDIKPGNLMRSKFGDYKLGDFGIAKHLQGTIHANTAIGSEPYAAPEVIGEKYDARADLYSLGLVLYQLANGGFLPFYTSNMTQKKQKNAILRRLGGDTLPPPLNADDDLSRIILKACAFQPEDRFSCAQEMYDALAAWNQMPEQEIQIKPQADLDLWQPKKMDILGIFGLAFTVTPEMRYMAQKLTGYTITPQEDKMPSSILTPHMAAHLPAWRIRAPWFPFNKLTIHGYTSIADRAFRGRKDFISVHFTGGSIQSIGAEAFIHCSNLGEIHCASGLIQIMNGAFSDCIRLARCQLPDSVETLGDAVFSGCIALPSLRIPERVQAIGNRLCDGCTALAQVTLPSALRSIGQAAFRNSGLQKILLPDSCIQLGEAVFSGCKKLASVQVSLDMAIVPENCFSGCISLAQVDLPFRLVEIRDRAFYGCTALAQMVIPQGVRRIGAEVFAKCDNLTMIRIPDSVKYIGENALPEKRKLRSKLTVIARKDSYAWDYCKQYGIRVKEA